MYMVAGEQYNADVGRYECRCLGGRVGGRCQSLPGCHHQQPCHNGGVCVDEQQPGVAARCLCPSGFTGRFCDVDIDDCASQPCVNGRSYSKSHSCRYFRVCISAAYAIVRCPFVRLSVRPSVSPSRSCILSKRINISSNFFCHRI